MLSGDPIITKSESDENNLVEIKGNPRIPLNTWMERLRQILIFPFFLKFFHHVDSQVIYLVLNHKVQYRPTFSFD